MAFDLARHRRILEEQALPRYERLGSLAFTYLQGSLVSGYTERADLDVIMLWDQPEVPTGPARQEIVGQLDERKPGTPFVVDCEDIHLERWVIAGQEYNLAHQTLSQFQGMVRAVLDARAEASQILDPLTAVSGFYYGELLVDHAGHGEQAKEALRRFPAALKSETARRARGHRETSLTHLRTFAERADWLMFHADLIGAVRMVLQALFAAEEVYYPGDKWLRQAIVRFGLGPRVLAAFDTLWAREAEPAARIAALAQLFSLLDEGGSSAAAGGG
jgi:hypothetical protein